MKRQTRGGFGAGIGVLVCAILAVGPAHVQKKKVEPIESCSVTAIASGQAGVRIRYDEQKNQIEMEDFTFQPLDLRNAKRVKSKKKN